MGSQRELSLPECLSWHKGLPSSDSDQAGTTPWLSWVPSLPCRFQTRQPHNHMRQFLKVNLSIYISYWFCLSGEPQLIHIPISQSLLTGHPVPGTHQFCDLSTVMT